MEKKMSSVAAQKKTKFPHYGMKTKNARKSTSSRRAIVGTARYRRYSQFVPCNYLRLPLSRQGQIESFRQPLDSFSSLFSRFNLLP
ncbi:MAG: hypothetical protein VZQ47_11900 [Treponema sp.]|nr:hypothetical protein [Treponema sp.]MEE3436246.1 hypothetical protein [Treponema sp.]